MDSKVETFHFLTPQLQILSMGTVAAIRQNTVLYWGNFLGYSHQMNSISTEHTHQQVDRGEMESYQTEPFGRKIKNKHLLKK